MEWILPVWLVILTVYHLIKMVREMNRLTKVEIPRQLVELVQQAHQAEHIRTMWDIKVSERMRDALCAPLTPEQLAVIRSAEKGVFSTYVKCSLLSSNYQGEELSGVVQVAVRVSSKFSELPLVCPDVKLRITVSGVGTPGIEHRWVLTSVERIE